MNEFIPINESHDSEESHCYCLKCDCILTQYEGTICCSCEELYPDFYE